MGARPSLPSIVVLTSALLATTACEVAVDPIEVPRGCPEMPVRGPTAAADVPYDQLIDDFEDGDIGIVSVSGRNGYWNFMNNPSSSMIGARPSSSCAARDGFAGHFVAAGFSSHGASWIAYFVSPAPLAVPYDAQMYRYTGISFWAAIGAGRAPFPVELGVSTMDTVPSYEYYGTRVDLTHSWQRFVIPFSKLAQTGSGPRFPMMRLEALVGFIIWPEQGQFDIWIDDVRFEKESAAEAQNDAGQ